MAYIVIVFRFFDFRQDDKTSAIFTDSTGGDVYQFYLHVQFKTKFSVNSRNYVNTKKFVYR